jgi:hypothetical protein
MEFVLVIDVSTLQGPVLLQELSALQLCYIWMCPHYRGMCCTLTCLHYRGVCCIWTCLHHSFLYRYCSWRCLHYRGLICIWMCLH